MNAGRGLPGLAENFESRLAKSDDSLRRRHGVYYTPPVVAAAMIQAVDHGLKSQLGLPLGLADDSRRKGTDVPLVSILDPACGDGVFLEAAVRQIYQNYRSAGNEPSWPSAVHCTVLPRLFGCELFPEAAADAKQRLIETLAETGVTDVTAEEIQIRIGDALAESTWSADEHFSVIVGNPPYSAAAALHGEWIKSLMTGSGDPSRNYYQVAGEPLREKKLWLHDDYVQFFRLAQRHLDRSGVGILAFLTNHGYLDNPTFRGMRWELLRGFDQIHLVDLHGNVKKREKSETEPADENLFAIEQGVAIGLFTKTSASSELATVRRGDLWGTRPTKLARLAGEPLEEIAADELTPSAPYYFFMARDQTRTREYERGLPILELFAKYASAVVTARDKIVIDTDRESLLERIGQFRDVQLTDDEIRVHYFARSRGAKYPAGETRSWKLAAARDSLRADEHWRERPQRALYRPFDYRWIYWTPEMIDWPRREIMGALNETGTIALIVRRQMPTGQECNYFGVTDAITLDGVLRSDNRGNESILPLAIAAKNNLRHELLEVHLQRWQAVWSDVPTGPKRAIAPQCVAALLYALFHATSYRERYADQLRIEYPRLFFPQTWSLAQQLTRLGQRLIDAHLLRGKSLCEEDTAHYEIGRGFPKYIDGQIFVSKDQVIAEVSLDVWKARFGVHQVLEKWLKDRRGQRLSSADAATYRQIIAAVKLTIQTRREIDAALESCGGWAAAMVDRDGRTLG
ncbi:type ISP restriction/modification enzyme [Blastopirellula marina]|uniref:site-specific DNA-methyltransferase (adenine-specific) n=1 Tax=Blastopirellula marina DSM 3645 TaxID=314230 RepID=A3ZY15_9BACT|nr:type ISP restriction/modification enzyme [Blastopirellula marina]EAQ78726.1 adenine specific DNA methyltransferase [Blastopirellula marina DSM 3645]